MIKSKLFNQLFNKKKTVLYLTNCIILLLSILIVSCTKNNESVKPDTTIPPSALVKNIKLLDFPELDNTNGEEWDDGSSPDIFIIIRGINTNNTVIFTSENAILDDLKISDLPIDWHFDHAGELKIPDLSRYYMIDMYDNDTGQEFPDDYMGTANFRLSDYMEGADAYPAQITVLQNNIKLNIDIEWSH